MKVYLVQRTDKIGYDEYDAFLVRAENERQARTLADCGYWAAAGYAPDEERSLWFAASTEVTEITSEGKPEILMASFNAG